MLHQWLFAPEFFTLAVVAIGIFLAGFTSSKMGEAYRSIGDAERIDWRS